MLEGSSGSWRLAGADEGVLDLPNAYLGYLQDRNYSPRTIRTYGYGLLAFGRWLERTGVRLEEVTTDTVLAFLSSCRHERVTGRPSPNVLDMQGNQVDRLAATSINLRLAAVSGMFEYRSMRSPEAPNPIPKGKPSAWFAPGERSGLLAHTKRRPAPRSRLRLRTARRLPRALTRAEVAALLGSLRCRRDLAMVGLMLYCGLRSCDVLALDIVDVDIGARWLLVHGKGGKDRRVPFDIDLASVLSQYLLTERGESVSPALFLVAKGPTRGQRLSPAGLRTIFRYHRGIAGVGAGAPHALRHTFGTALAEAGVQPGRHAGPTRTRPRRHHHPLHPPGPDPREGSIRCRSYPSTRHQPLNRAPSPRRRCWPPTTPTKA